MGPFDRFNDRAKRVLALAQDEAVRFNHDYIGVEHLVLGLIREGEDVAARVLNSVGVDLSQARSSVEFIIGRGHSTTTPTEITLSPRTKKVIELAVDESRKLGHSHVGTEHLLLGVVLEDPSTGAGVLESLGVRLEDVRHRVIATLAQQASGGEGPRVAPASPDFIAAQSPMAHDRLDSSSKRALARAYWEAGRANEEKIMPHHLLLALVADNDPWIGRMLTEFGTDPATLAARVDEAAPLRPGPRAQIIGEDFALTNVITRAAALAAERNRGLIRKGHLLLAISASNNVGAHVLASVGATPQRIREILDRMNE